MSAARTFVPDAAATASATTLVAGYLLLTAFLVGGVFKALGLPRLTGYLAAGMITGPEVLALVSADMVANLQILNGVAISLIALSAGAEMDLRAMRPLLRAISWISGVAVLGTTVLLSVVTYLISDLLPFMAPLDPTARAALSTVLGVTLVAGSPAVIVALRDEMDAEGPFVQTTIAVTVIGSLLVILMFGGASSVAKAATGGSADVFATIRTLAWDVVGSLGAGALVGLGMSGYFRRFGSSGALVIVALSFVIAEVGNRLSLDPMIISLAAGVFLRNFTRVADDVRDALDSASMPVYVAFFAVTGAGIHIHSLFVVWLPATCLVVTRAIGLLLGTRVGGRLAGAPEVVRRHVGVGLMPQAGLALALALLFQQTFPDAGAGAAALVFGIVGINELLAPVLLRFALLRSGEAGRRHPEPTDDGPTVPEALAMTPPAAD